MTKKKIIEVFKDISNPDYSDAEKLEAIDEVIEYDMFNRVSKNDIVEVLVWGRLQRYINGWGL